MTVVDPTLREGRSRLRRVVIALAGVAITAVVAVTVFPLLADDDVAAGAPSTAASTDPSVPAAVGATPCLGGLSVAQADVDAAIATAPHTQDGAVSAAAAWFRWKVAPYGDWDYAHGRYYLEAVAPDEVTVSIIAPTSAMPSDPAATFDTVNFTVTVTWADAQWSVTDGGARRQPMELWPIATAFERTCE